MSCTGTAADAALPCAAPSVPFFIFALTAFAFAGAPSSPVTAARTLISVCISLRAVYMPR